MKTTNTWAQSNAACSGKRGMKKWPFMEDELYSLTWCIWVSTAMSIPAATEMRKGQVVKMAIAEAVPGLYIVSGTTEDETLKREVASLTAENATLSTELVKLTTDDVMLPTEHAGLLKEDVMLKTDDAMLITDDAMLDTEVVDLSTDEVTLRTGIASPKAKAVFYIQIAGV